MQKYLPLTFFNAQEHYLIHQVGEIEMYGPVHTRSMWMVERHSKSLKVFIRQREGLEGYMVYQSLVYISQCLSKLVAKIMKVPWIWDVNSINKFKGEVMVEKG
jgi:hypothetical protein